MTSLLSPMNGMAGMNYPADMVTVKPKRGKIAGK